VVTLPDVRFEDTGAVVGIDLGLNRPAVTSNNAFHGPRSWRAIEQRIFCLRRQLQAIGTVRAKRRLRRLSGRTARFRRECDHVLSKRIVHSVEPGTTLVIEHLTGIRARVKQRGTTQRRRLHAWSFAQLRQFLTYKAARAGLSRLSNRWLRASSARLPRPVELGWAAGRLGSRRPMSARQPAAVIGRDGRLSKDL
jgi:putative transposase